MKFEESETIEFKKSTSELKEGVKSISAILNKHGTGELYFGIKDDGTVLGQQISPQTLRDVSKTILENIEPKIYPRIQPFKIQRKNCVKDKLRWDTEIRRRAKLSDMNVKKLKAFLKAAGLRYDSIRNALGKLKLLSGGKILNAAVILFAGKPQDFFSNAKLRCAVFARRDTSFIVDRKEFEGDLFHLIETAEEYILENIHIGMRVEGLRRVDVPEIEREAFREAIINAFCHRDYREYDSVNIAIFKDRVEIRSPGLLYGDLTIEKITSKMLSERRNELIAELLHRVHFIEKWGRGIRLILSKEPTARFEEVGTHFTVSFNRKGVSDEPEKTTQKTTQKILELIQQNPQITRKELSDVLGITEDGVKFHLGQLKEKGLLRRIGPDKGGHWEIIKTRP